MKDLEKSKERYTFELTRDGKITGFGVNPWGLDIQAGEKGDLLAAKYNELMKIANQFYKASASVLNQRFVEEFAWTVSVLWQNLAIELKI